MIESQNTTTLTAGETGLALCDLHRMNGVRVTADNWREHIHFDRNTDLEEIALGHDAGRELAADMMRDGAEVMELMAALAISSVRFIRQLRQAPYLAPQIDPDVPLAGFIAYYFGGAGGGLRGPYARGFISGFASAARPVMPTSH